LTEKDFADLVQHLPLLRIHIDKVFRKEDKLHPNILYESVKDLIDIDKHTFRKQLSACIKANRIEGYRTGRGGKLKEGRS